MTQIFKENIIILHGMKDRLGRVYDAKEILKQVSDKSIYGYVGTVFFEDVGAISHQFHNIHVDENNNLVGDCTILETPMGKLLESFFNENLELETSFCGLGKVDKDNNVSEYILKSINFSSKFKSNA